MTGMLDAITAAAQVAIRMPEAELAAWRRSTAARGDSAPGSARVWYTQFERDRYGASCGVEEI